MKKPNREELFRNILNAIAIYMILFDFSKEDKKIINLLINFKEK